MVTCMSIEELINERCAVTALDNLYVCLVQPRRAYACVHTSLELIGSVFWISSNACTHTLVPVLNRYVGGDYCHVTSDTRHTRSTYITFFCDRDNGIGEPTFVVENDCA